MCVCVCICIPLCVYGSQWETYRSQDPSSTLLKQGLLLFMPHSDNLNIEFLDNSPVTCLLSHESGARIMHKIRPTRVSGLELRPSDVLNKQVSKSPCWPLKRKCFYLSSICRHIKQMYKSNIYQCKIIRKVILKQLFNIHINFIIYLKKQVGLLTKYMYITFVE